MPVRGLKEVRKSLNKAFADISGPRAEKTLTEVLIIAAGYASTMTPIDTSNLINSQYRKINAYGTRVVGAVGYTAAYAAAVHDAKGTLKGTNTPRSKTDPGRGNFWDPDGEPEFLRKAFEDPDAKSDIEAAIKRGMKI